MGQYLDLSQPQRSLQSQDVPLDERGHRPHGQRGPDSTVTHTHKDTHTHLLTHRGADRKTRADTLGNTQTRQTLDSDTSVNPSQAFPGKQQGAVVSVTNVPSQEGPAALPLFGG